MAAKKRIHVRCPMCSSLRRERGGRLGIAWPGELEIVVQTITSGGRGKIRNQWDRYDVREMYAPGGGFQARVLVASLLEQARGVVAHLEDLLADIEGREHEAEVYDLVEHEAEVYDLVEHEAEVYDLTAHTTAEVEQWDTASSWATMGDRSA